MRTPSHAGAPHDVLAGGRFGNRAVLATLAHRTGPGDGRLQAKLDVGAPNDAKEAEADAAAQAITRGTTIPKLSPVRHGEGAAGTVDDDFRSSLGPSTTLPRATRARLAPALGVSLDGVRVHTGEAAARATKSVGARALTVGSSIAFGRGQFAPETSAGLELVAHEVAHVVQQHGGSARVQRDLPVHPATYGSSFSDEPGATLFPALVSAYQAATTMGNGEEQAFRDLIFTAIDSVSADQGYDPTQRAGMRQRATDILNVRVGDGASNSWEVLGGLGALDAQQGVDDLGTGSVSLGTGLLIRGLAEDSTVAIAGDLGSVADNVVGQAATAVVLNLNAGLTACTHPETRYRVELEGTIFALLDARVAMAAAHPAERAALGARIGQLSRRAMLLDAAISGIRSGLDQPGGSSLDQQMQAVSGRIAAIRSQARTEADTTDAMGGGADLLAMRTLDTPLSLLTQYGMSERFGLGPEDTLPQTTDQATSTLLERTQGEMARLQTEVAHAHDAVIPREPRYTMDEFLQVYRRWRGFYSRELEQSNPMLQLLLSMFDRTAVARLTVPNWDSMNEDQRKETLDRVRSPYELTGIPPTGLSSISASLARVVMFRTFVPMIGEQLGGESADFADEVGSLPTTHSLLAGGRATSPTVSLMASFQVAANGSVVATDPAGAERARSGSTAQAFSDVAARPSTGPNATELDLGRLLGPRAAGAANPGAPIMGLHETSAQEGWSYLVDVPDANDPDRILRREHVVMPPEVAQYLLMRRRLRVAGSDSLVPRLPDGRAIGDVPTRTQGLTTATATSAARAKGEVNPQPTTATTDATRALGRGHAAARSGDELGDVGSLLYDMREYLDAYFVNRTSAEDRIAAVLAIAGSEQGVARDLQEAFSAGHLAKVIGMSAGLAVASAALERLGPLGQIVNAGVNGYMVAHGSGPLEALTGLVMFMREASRITSFQQARAWAYVTRPVIGDLSTLIDTAASHATTSAARTAVEAIVRSNPTTPRALAESAGRLAADPAARRAMLDACNAELARMGAAGQGNTPEFRAMEAMQVELSRAGGGSAPPPSPAVAAALDAPLPGQRAETEATTALAFARPRSDAERAALAAAIPAEMAQRVRVVEDPLLSGTTVQVIAMRNEVQVRVGREATAADVTSHVQTASDISRFVGPLGRVRQLVDRAQSWLDGHPAFGTRGDTARREVEKLGRMIEELRAREEALDARVRDLESGHTTYNEIERAALRSEIESLERQLMLHAEDISSLEAGGTGVFAVDSAATVRDALIMSGRSREDAAAIVETARGNRHLDALAQLALSGAYLRLLQAGMSTSRIESVLDQPGGYGMLVRGFLNPTSRAGASLGPGIATTLIANREARAQTELTRTPEQDLASQWGIDLTLPETSPTRFREGELPGGMTVREIERRANDPTPPAAEPRIVFRRWRYVQRVGRARARPFAEWAQSGFQANLNRDTSSPFEAAAVAALGGVPNNGPSAAGGQHTYEYGEWLDARGRFVASGADAARRPRGATDFSPEVETRPDGTRPRPDGGFDVIEHKDVSARVGTLNDSVQLRAQREMAALQGRGRYELVMTSDADPAGTGLPPVQPSGPLAQSCGERAIFYFNGTTRTLSHVWSVANNRWEPR